MVAGGIKVIMSEYIHSRSGGRYGRQNIIQVFMNWQNEYLMTFDYSKNVKEKILEIRKEIMK